MNLQVYQDQPNSSTTKRRLEGDREVCQRKRAKKHQGQHTQETHGSLLESGHHLAHDHRYVKSSAERPVKDSQVDKVVVTINKDGLMLRVLLSDRVPYMCPQCGWTFTHAASLKQHGKDSHGYKEAKKMLNGGRGNEIIITKSRVDHTNVLESCILKDASLPGEDECGQETLKSPSRPLRNISTSKVSHAASEKVATKEKVVAKKKVAPREIHEVACNRKVTEYRKILPKEKVSDKESVANKRKVAQKEKMVVKLFMKAKRSTKNIRDAGDSDKVQGDATSLASAKSSEPGRASHLIQAMVQRKDANDGIGKQNSNPHNGHAVDGLTIESTTCVGKAAVENQECRRKHMHAVSGSSSESTTHVALEGSFPSAEDIAMTEEEGSGKRKRQKYRPKCSICGFKCHSEAQRYVHSANVHGLFRNVTDAWIFKPKHLDEPQGDKDSNQTRPKPVLHKCPHCSSCSFDPDTLQQHLGSHCGVAKGIKCHLCTGAIELWDNDRFEDLEALSNKLQEIEDDVQGSGWDRISFSDNGNWSWTSATSGNSKSVEHEEGWDGVRHRSNNEGCNDIEDRDAPPAEDRIQQGECQKKSHARCKRKKAYPPFVSSCYECGEKFFFRAHSMNHYQRAHRSLTCRDCGTVVPSLSALISHSHQEHKRRGIFRCAHCPQAFHTTGKLHYHLEGHLGLFRCNACDKSFMTLFTLDLHTANYCPASEKQRAEGPNPMTCPVCREEFVRKSFFYKHMSQWHPNERVEIQLKEKPTPLICDQCGKFYSNSTSLSIHMRKHRSGDNHVRVARASPGYLKTLQDRKSLKVHASSNQIDHVFICELCGKKFKSSSLLKLHRRRHLGVLPFKCHFCGKGFLEGKRRLLHEASMHTGGRKHMCDVCGKSFATATGLKTHGNTHSSIRPFQCNACEASFVDRFSLQSHQRTHTKPFRCDYCDEGFAQKGGRRRHLLRIHSIVEPIQRFRMKIFTNGSSSLQLQDVTEPSENHSVTQPMSEGAGSIQDVEKSLKFIT